MESFKFFEARIFQQGGVVPEVHTRRENFLAKNILGVNPQR